MLAVALSPVENAHHVTTFLCEIPLKLRHIPQDFQVEELSPVRPARGRFALYVLKKRSLGTLDAVSNVSRQWRIPRNRIAFGGLKDAQAVTRQYLTIEHGPRRGLRQSLFALVYRGQLDRPFHASDISGNRFRLVLRDLDRRWCERIAECLDTVTRDGVPNYFDDQRFWSLGRSGMFVARAWIDRQYEQACRLVLTDPLESDRPADLRQRKKIAEQWGSWERLRSRLEAGDHRAMVEYLAQHPSDFRRALTCIAHDQRSLYLAAYQSFLWNELLAQLLRDSCAPDELAAIKLRAGNVVLFRRLRAELRTALVAMQLPLPSARLAPATPEIGTLLERVLERQGLTRRQIKLDYPRDTFFSKGERAVLVFPRHVSLKLADDELHPGRHKALLQFDLPRGSYATMLVKQLAVRVEST